MDEHRQHSCCKPDQHPQHHNREAPKLAAAGNPDVIYTCPMHPQIRQQGPGFSHLRHDAGTAGGHRRTSRQS